MGDADQQLVDLLEQVWQSYEDVCAGLTEQQWKTPTDLPGWSVQDNVVHVVGIESSVLGRPAPEHTPPDLEHVKNDIGRSNEVWVDSRRAWPGVDVFTEFQEVTGARIAQLRAFGDAEFSAASWTPAGPGTVRDLLPFRVFDSWAHEQDIRRALGRPGGFTGPVAEMAFARIVNALPFVVGKKVAPPDGTTVVFEITGAQPQTVAIGVAGGRAKLVDRPADPAVTLTLDAEAVACLGMGRWHPDDALADGVVTIEGDDALGRRIVGNMNFMF